MGKSIQLCVLASLMTLADLAVFVYCTPILCQAWGANGWFMCSLFAGMVVWFSSLANLWRAAFRSVCVAIQRPSTLTPLLPHSLSDEGSNPRV